MAGKTKINESKKRRDAATAVSRRTDSATHEAFSQKTHKVITNKSPIARPLAGKGPQRDRAQQEMKYGLHSVGSRFSNVAGMQHRTLSSLLAYMNRNHVCPHHDEVLGEGPANTKPGRGLDAMTRYLTEGPSDQYAIFIQPDTGDLSLRKGCLCVRGWEQPGNK